MTMVCYLKECILKFYEKIKFKQNILCWLNDTVQHKFWNYDEDERCHAFMADFNRMTSLDFLYFVQSRIMDVRNERQEWGNSIKDGVFSKKYRAEREKKKETVRESSVEEGLKLRSTESKKSKNAVHHQQRFFFNFNTLPKPN